MVGVGHSAGPILPAAAIHRLRGRAVAGQQRPGDGIALLVEMVSQQAYLGRGGAPAVREQHGQVRVVQG
jgi:hypothetical protein